MNKNFMVDLKTIKKICGYAGLQKDDVVLEIGAGTGNLTSELLKKCAVVAVERDGNFACALRNKFASGNLTVIEGDALKVNFPRFNKIVSNLPYSISRKITEKILKYEFDLAVLVYQKEYALKLTSKPGLENYKCISVIAQSCSEIEILDYLSPEVFQPEPEVMSAVVRMRRKFAAGDSYINFVKSLFNKRNRIIKGTGKRVFELTPDEILELYKSLKKE